MGPSSGLAAVAASAVFAAGITDQQEVASFVAGITLASGALFLVLAVFKLGWIAQFLSRAVVTGFLFGAALDVVIGELPKITGTKVTGSNSLQELFSWVGNLSDTDGLTLLVGIVALAVVFGLRILAPRVPGALVLVVGGLLASWLLDLGAHGVALVGEVPRGLPRFEVPDGGLLWDHVVVVAMAAFALMLIGFSQTAGDARAFAVKHHYQIDINQESVAQALANTGAGLSGLPVSTSLRRAHQRSLRCEDRLVSLTSGLTVPLTRCSCAAVLQSAEGSSRCQIIEAVVMGMMNVPEMRRMARVQRFDFWIAMTPSRQPWSLQSRRRNDRHRTLAAVADRRDHTSQHRSAWAEPGTQVYRDISNNPEDEQPPGIAVVRLDGDLSFATAEAPKTGSATSSTHPAGSRGSCSTARASTSSTLRVRPRWRKSRGLLRSPGSPSGLLG
jgi:MFS superfamily sulfate permease-like transporter